MIYLTPYLKLNSIKSFVCENEYLYTLELNDTNIKVYKNFTLTETYDSDYASSLYMVNEMAIASSSIFFEKAIRKNYTFEEKLNFSNVFFKNIFLLYEAGKMYHFFDTSNNTLIKKVSFEECEGLNIFTNKYLICRIRDDKNINKVVVRDFNNNNEIWQYDARLSLPEGYDHKWGVINPSIPLIIHNDILIITTFKNLIGLNINTGELIYNREIMGIGKHLLYENKLYIQYYNAFTKSHVFQIRNAFNGLVITEKTYPDPFFTKNEREQPYLTEQSIYQKYIFFSSGTGYQIFFMNIETLEIEKTFSIKATVKEKKEPIRYKPFIVNGHLYQLVGKLDLQIFDIKDLL